MTKTEEIKIEEDTSPMGGQKLSHPAFGQISAARISGHVNLYGSEFHHHGFIAIRINHSMLQRTLSRDWPFQREEIVEVYLSEAQWASFVSSLNMGSGVQCTISTLNGQYVPAIASQPDKKSQFSNEVSEKLKNASQDIDDLVAKIDELKLSEKVKTELKRSMNSVKDQIINSTKFVAESFSEHMEEQTEKAKCEVNAYISGTIQRAGLQAVIQNPQPLLIEDKK